MSVPNAIESRTPRSCLTIAALLLLLLPTGCRIRQLADPSSPFGPDRHRGGSAQDIPRHPSELSYPPLVFEPPEPADYRQVLDNGLAVYAKADPTTQLFSFTVYLKMGSLEDPRDKKGLAGLTGTLLRQGGTKSRTPQELDEDLERLAATLGVSVQDVVTVVSLRVLQRNAPAALELLREVLLEPAFDAKEFQRRKNEEIDLLRGRNDEPHGVLGREFTRLLYGEHLLVWQVRKKSLESIEQKDLAEFYRARLRAQNSVAALSGPLPADELMNLANRVLGGLPRESEVPLLTVPEVTHRAQPATFFIEKTTNQGFVAVGQMGISWSHPDRHALEVLNYILGAGGFTARLIQRIRSDEGLAYSVRSHFEMPMLYPGAFQVSFQSKVPTVGAALGMVRQEIERIRDQGVTAEELERAKAALTERFPDRFATTQGTLEALASLEFWEKPLDEYKTYRQKITAVTLQDALRVAREHLEPQKMFAVIVGPRSEIVTAAAQTVLQIESLFGPARDLPLKEPWSDDF